MDIAPRSGYSYSVGNEYDKIADSVVKQLSNGRSITECFNLFNEKPAIKTKKELKQERIVE